jgi:YaiO family outer membrane protein
MRHSLNIALLTIAIAWTADTAMAATGISIERAGLGLKVPAATPSPAGSFGLQAELTDAWLSPVREDVVYGGVREGVRFGARTTESVSGIYHPLSEAWGISLEASVLPETSLVPRRYSLGGQLRTALAGGGGFSIGLKYRIYGTDSGYQPGQSADASGISYGYALVASRIPGVSFGPSYQLQLSYQYNAANTFGLAVGREVETFTPGFDVPGNGRQFTFTGQHWLTPSWALSYDLLSADPGALRLQGLRLGMRYRF